MAYFKIITDTASDITKEQAEEMDIIRIPLSIRFGSDEMTMDTEDDFQKFFERLEEEHELPTTSQPSPDLYVKEYEKARQNMEDVLVLTISSGLSGTINAANAAKEIAGYDRITIIDTRQAIITQRMLVEYAVCKRKQGISLEKVADGIVEVRDRMVVCGVLDTLTYLRKGGRIPPAFDLIGNALNIKPVIELKDKVLVRLGIARGNRKGKERLWKEYDAEAIDPEWPVYIGYTYDREKGEAFRRETEERFRLPECKAYAVSGVIGTHVGKNCIAIAFVRRSAEVNEEVS